jgi:hypothetical protein
MSGSNLVKVVQLVSSRYPQGVRPESWSDRIEGIDVIRTQEGKELRLMSDGGQSPPQSGWTILLLDACETGAYRWTLYGLSRSTQSQSDKSESPAGH